MKLEKPDHSQVPSEAPRGPGSSFTALPSPGSPVAWAPLLEPPPAASDPEACSRPGLHRRPSSYPLRYPDSRYFGTRTAEKLRYDLTSLETSHSFFGFDQVPPASEPLWPPTPSSSVNAPLTEETALHTGKRPSTAEKRMTPTFESPPKKPRLVAPGSLSLPLTQAQDDLEADGADLISPRFYSHHPGTLSDRAPRYKPLDVTTAAIMSAARDPPEGITTLRLPKGQISAANVASPARSSGTPGSWSSVDQPSTMSRSLEGRSLSSPSQLLQGLGLAEFLEHDARPTFIIDLDDTANFEPGTLHMIYVNASLRSSPGILAPLQADTTDPEHPPQFSRFREWIATTSTEKGSESAGPESVEYAGTKWTCSTLRRRFRFVCGLAAVSTPTPTSLTEKMGPKSRSSEGDYFGAMASSPGTCGGSTSELSSRPGTAMDESTTPFDDPDPPPQFHTTFDWTKIPLDDPNLSAHHRLARSIDWAATPLGPVEDWPADLRIMSNMIMGSPHPAAMYWGQDHVAIYNEAYTTLAGSKHPHLMGKRYEDAWPEIWQDIAPIMKAAWHNGDATMKYDDLLFLTRQGFLEETFFNWALIPLVGADGRVVAIFNPAFENTRRKISERRMLTLREIGVMTSQARDVRGFWSQVRKGLQYNEFDVPFALIYSVDDGNDSDVSSMHSASFHGPPRILLEGSIGVPEGHRIAVPAMDLKSSNEGLGRYMRESLSCPTEPIVLSESDGSLPTDLLDDLAWGGYGDRCRTIVVFPVHPTTAGESVVGFIALGVNPRRPYDSDYRLFVNLLSRQLATSMASVVLLEEEVKGRQREARLAEQDRQQLSQQLHLRTQEAVESEYRFTKMAEFGPVGMFITDGSGHITYCNEKWWEISGHNRSPSTLDAWMESIRDEDRSGVENAWRRLVEEKAAVTHEFRFRGSRRLQDGHSVDNWALMSAYPETDEHGVLKSIFGCMTDISQQKWAEDFQKQRRDEAVELKRQQENFIDITSHEMRNPLSAILQCADEITSSLNQYRVGDPSSYGPNKLNILIDSCMEAANTISLCASHQKRIVDDILTLSKLDSNLLLVTPVDVQPVTVVQNVLRMFESELNSNDIKGQFRVEQSYQDLAVDWAKLDPSRLRQVLINLMTNAIKFTQGRPTRSITISLGASKDAASEGLAYIPLRRPDQDDVTEGEDWADGEKLNLHVAVTDTGPGLDDDEKKILFQRFSQVSPRTHVQYGGSGLGLFICRTLTEMQGGQIGVRSRKGEGSTFAFYIKIRRADNPQPDRLAEMPTPRMSPAKLSTVPSPQQLSRSSSAGEIIPPQVGLEPAATNLGRMWDVLIVEDNLVNQKVLQRQLQLSGNNTSVANHGGEALEALRRSRFWDEERALMKGITPLSHLPSGTGGDTERRNISVILMDLEMPVMDGMSCTSEIRKLESDGIITHHIPIIAVTAYARPEQVENAKAAGVDDVISKPFRIPELMPKIEELVLRYNMQPHL
ncbi:hypothetical protein QBC47DRAFT_59888 [Echria macrotheca]|uniref:Uncharacterized protein n=1 Tax=Echria macrotheca TaxID=438768 RepID=A0AAJ0B6D2_9PEZI|nr:hypothetical protein QBC47DRAFT_59888 [Echria macrotheca]